MKKNTLHNFIIFLLLCLCFSCKLHKNKSHTDILHSIKDENFISLDVDNINNKISLLDKNLTPKKIMKIYYPYRIEGKEGNQIFKINEFLLENNYALVVLLFDNILDDSIRGEKYIMKLKRDNNKWKVISILKNFRCWENRGHSNWDTIKCK